MTENEIAWTAVIFIGVLIIWYGIERRSWIQTQRLKLIETDFYGLRFTPSILSMYLRFWVWDINKFSE